MIEADIERLAEIKRHLGDGYGPHRYLWWLIDIAEREAQRADAAEADRDKWQEAYEANDGPEAKW